MPIEGMIERQVKRWSLTPLTDAERAAMRVEVFNDIAAEIEPGFAYTVTVYEVGGKAPSGGYELILTVGFIKSIDIPLDQLGANSDATDQQA